MEIWKKVDELKKAGLSYNQIANRVGVSKTTVRRWHLEENCATCKNELKIDKLMWDELQNPDKLTRNDIIRAKHEFKVGDRVNMDGSRRYWIVTDIDTSGPFPVYKMSSEDEANKNYYVIGDKELKKVSANKPEETTKFKSWDEFEKEFFTDEYYNNAIAYHQKVIDDLKKSRDAQKWKFTEDEKVILRNIPKEYNWLIRSQGGDLFVFTSEPQKIDYYWETVNKGKDSYCEIISTFNHLFKCIQWSDTEPCEFRKFI